jgi:folate-dependent phosphoribosylglycinamide formyltransferase PurN
MKVTFLTGSHPRHAAIARALFDAGHLHSLVIEQRKPHIPSPPEELSDELKTLFNLHFTKRQIAEEKFFPTSDLPDVPTLKISLDELNSEKVHSFINKSKPELMISYGVHMLTNETINCCEGEAWNIHGGLSPLYKGSITHFWPSYLLEPQMTGMTIHNLSQQLDAGDVIHQCNAEMVKGDGLHDLACRAVKPLLDELPKVISLLEKNGTLIKHKHKSSGKLWTSSQWRPEHLRLIYQTYNDQIVDMVLNKEIKGRIPNLYRQL